MNKKLLVFAVPAFLMLLLLSTLSATAQSQECPQFGGYPTNPVDDGGCVFAGGEDPGVITSTVPLGWWAQYWNGQEVVEADEGVEITTDAATFWPLENETVPPVTPEPVEPEDPIGDCPVFAGYASSPVESEPGVCSIGWDPDRGVITGTVPQGWILQHDQSDQVAQPGEEVTIGSGTFRPIPQEPSVVRIFLPWLSKPSEDPIGDCPVFAGYASSPVESEPGVCSIGWDPDRGVITGTVPQGWILQHDQSDQVAQPGEEVTIGSGTFRPVPGSGE